MTQSDGATLEALLDHRTFLRYLERRVGSRALAEDILQDAFAKVVSTLATTLKPEYAEALLAVDVGGQAVKAFAEAKGLSASNGAVRVFRARRALKKRVTQSCVRAPSTGASTARVTR